MSAPPSAHTTITIHQRESIRAYSAYVPVSGGVTLLRKPEGSWSGARLRAGSDVPRPFGESAVAGFMFSLIFSQTDPKNTFAYCMV